MRWFLWPGSAAMILALASGCGDKPPPESAAPAVEASATAELKEAGQDAELASIRTATAVIDTQRIRSAVAELADDAYAGRGPGTDGDRAAQDYIAGRLEALGLEPAANDGSWFQPFDLVSVTTRPPATWSFASSSGSHSLTLGRDFIAGIGVQSPHASIDAAELVFVGYGIQAPEYQWDDFKGVDLSGKVLLMLNNDPDWDDELFAGARRLYYGRWTYKYESAARQGAVGAIIIHTNESAGYPWQVVQTSWSGAQFELPAGDEPRLQVAAWASEAAVARLLASVDVSLEALITSARSWNFTPFPLRLTTSLALDAEISQSATANVLGMLPGSDPALREQVVVYTAHHDHLGIGRPNLAGDHGDVIYNGARDNASGTAMALAVADAYAALPEPPRRSVLFAFVGAEEQGLLGSKFYAAQPTVAPGRIAANVNFDAANIWGRTRDVTYVGKGKSSLDAVAQQVATFQNRVVKGDQFPSQGIFYRSDQFSFARIGVPALYVNGGTDFVGREPGWGAAQMGAYIQRNYHQPSDELTEDWNFDGMVDDARFGFMAGWLVANDDDMPRWYEGDEFEAARLRALADDAGN